MPLGGIGADEAVHFGRPFCIWQLLAGSGSGSASGEFYTGPDGRPWQRVERTRCLTTNAGTEGGLCEAEIASYFPYNAPAIAPARVLISLYDATNSRLVTTTLAPVTQWNCQVSTNATWRSIETLTMRGASADGHRLSSQVVIYSGQDDGAGPNRLEWSLDAAPTLVLEFDRTEVQETRLHRYLPSQASLQAEFEVVQDDSLLQAIAMERSFDPLGSRWQAHASVTDMGLAPEEVVYYALYAVDPATGVLEHRPMSQAAAMPTGGYQFAEHLYRLLPAVHRQYDEPTPSQADRGQLRRFLQVAGTALDHLRSQAEGLAYRHDVLQAQADLLPHLARWIGWEPDRTRGVLDQRQEILFAPEIYQSLGTAPNLKALVNRLTGWDCRVKEFRDNVFFTLDTRSSEPGHTWELWEAHSADGSAWSKPIALIEDHGSVGRPAAVRDSSGRPWLFWHANLRGRREIWLLRPGHDTPQPAMSSPEDGIGHACSDECPAAVQDGQTIRLFWASDRDGQWSIWTRAYHPLLPSVGQAERVTPPHSGAARCPAAVCDAKGRIWLFWQLDRRGPEGHLAAGAQREGRLGRARPGDYGTSAGCDAGGRRRGPEDLALLERVPGGPLPTPRAAF